MTRREEPLDPLEMGAEIEDLFETIRDEVDDPTVAHKYGRQPLAVLEEARKRGELE